METDLQRLAAACNKAAEHYCEHPGTAGPETVIDIYRAMAALASMLDMQAQSAADHSETTALMGFADWFTKKKPDRDDADEPQSPIYIMGGQSVRFLSPRPSPRRTSRSGNPRSYTGSPISSLPAVQSVPWFCEPDPDVNVSERVGNSKIKAINDLLKSPNDTYTSQQLQYWIALNLMLYARAHFKVGVGTNEHTERPLPAGRQACPRSSQHPRRCGQVRVRLWGQHDHSPQPAHSRTRRCDRDRLRCRDRVSLAHRPRRVQQGPGRHRKLSTSRCKSSAR